MKKQKQKKKNKKYTKKYYTGGRVDYRKGGRVSLAKGGNPQYGDTRITEGGVKEEFSPVGWNATKDQPASKGTPSTPVNGDTKITAVNKPNIPVTEPINKPVDKPVMPTVGNGQMSIGGVGGNDAVEPEPIETPVPTPKPPVEEDNTPPSIGGVGGGNVQPTPTITNGDEPVVIGDIPGGGNYVYTPPVEQDTTSTGKQTTLDTIASPEKLERLGRTQQQIEDAAKGIVPEEAKIPTAEQVGYQRDAEGKLVLDEVGNPIPLKEQEAIEMKPTTKVKGIDADISGIQEDIKTGKVKEAEMPIDITAATYDATQVGEEAKVKAAEGELKDTSLAEAAKVDRVAPIEGAKVEIPTGALTERVVGTLSEDAKSEAAQNAGTSLRRITRAKKQLSKAGLSDVEITEIGNDPEALEDKLADFTEEQRGIIEGLPEEALVSTQIDGLLAGIEDGEIPVWARPAVASVESMLAKRGLSASSVGRDALVNTIIQAAMPIAQSNAQAIQSSVAQQKDIEFKESEANTQRKQQTALDNANKVFQMDMAQFSSDQQIALSNSKFLQTVGLTEASNQQQAVIQDALLMSQANLAEADFYQKTQIQNAQAFLTMDMANLNNQQQANVLESQQKQQRMLSNQSADNVAKQFNAVSENDTQRFMTGLAADINKFNSVQSNAMEQFNTNQENLSEARKAQRETDVAKYNAEQANIAERINAQSDFNREQFNTQQANVIEAANINYRRQRNTVNTAAQNQINLQNAMNAFGFSSQAIAFLGQELRDQAAFDVSIFENDENRKANIIATAIANEGKPGEKYGNYLESLLSSLNTSYKQGL
jgi:hypothetical protein